MNRAAPFPEPISSYLKEKTGTSDNVGLSGGTVMLYDDMVLKIEPYTEQTASAIRMMQWMSAKLPVPEILCHEVQDGRSYLLMSRIHGKMSCDTYYLEHSQELVSLLAKGLKMLWDTDISDCPRKRTLAEELKQARYNVEHGLVDVSRCEPETFGEKGFASPMALLEWLEKHQPACEPVLSHGDFCLPNIFLHNDGISGFIDLGDAGIADKWRDISLCYRSLKRNFDGTFGGKIYPDFNPDMLLEKLETEPDPEKLKYYLLLDELF